MKENLLRSMIRKQIKSSLKESPVRTAVGSTLGRVEKMAGVKMLKKALGQGGVQQQASGLLAVVKAISGDSPQVARALARMLMKGGIAANTEAPAVTEGLFDFLKKKEKEAPKNKEGGKEPIGVDYDGNYIYEAVSGALASKGDRLDKTQAMDMLRKTLRTKPASQQAEFVSDLVKSLELKGNINLLIRKLRKK